MNNKKCSNYFLRKSPKGKKAKIDFDSNISFWDNINDKNSEAAETDSEDLGFSFTSLEVEEHKVKDVSCVKFIIRKIEREDGCIRLHGNDVICTVKGEWTELDYEMDTKITVTSCLCCTNELYREIINGKLNITVDNDYNYLFIEDDLMTITNLCSSIRCYNRPLINDKVADLNFKYRDKSLVNGIIIHTVMEDVLINNDYTMSYITQAVKKAMELNVVNMFACNTNEKDVKLDILQSLNNINRFKRHNFTFKESEKRVVSLTANLKGNIDIVGDDTVLEIKSGKYMDISHKAQVLLYNILLKEKYEKDVDAYLYYVANDHMIKLDVKHSEVKSLLIRRNRLTLQKEIEPCSCPTFEPCQIINRILSFPDDHFLKYMWDSIEKEEKHRLKETWNPVTFKKQNNTNVVFSFEVNSTIIDDIYINIYNQDLIKLCKGIITSVEDNYLMVSLSEKINLENNSNYFISFGSNDLFFKYMRYSLIYIAYFRYTEESNHGFKLPGEDLSLDDDLEEFSMESDTEDVTMQDIDTVCTQTSPIMSTQTSSFLYFTPPDPSQPKYKYKIPAVYKKQFFELNEEQKNSLFLALNCENYKIIHGMPGTGKSTIIVLLIKILISLNLKVLLVCYTNLAITNILDKLKTVRYYRAKKEKHEFKTSEDVRKHYNNIDLVASTCFGFSDPIFIERKFDFCIIDEGSQQHLLLTLLPVSLSNRFVIFGDHLQLKPLVKSCKPLSLSLFEYLLDEDHSELHTQYRMGDNIMRLTNILFYENRLIAANKFEDRVIFIDSKNINYPEFIGNVRDSTILCYFNSQVKLTKLYTKCQVETIDRFQGSEADSIIIVFDPVSVCEVMESNERLNVALTRARKSLTLIGNREKMEDIEILRRLLEIL